MQNTSSKKKDKRAKIINRCESAPQCCDEDHAHIPVPHILPDLSISILFASFFFLNEIIDFYNLFGFLSNLYSLFSGKMATGAEFRQDMPPKGGYRAFNFHRTFPKLVWSRELFFFALKYYSK